MGGHLATLAPLRRLVGRNSLRHLLLGLSLVVVMLSIVGMHQLSVGHDLATDSQPSAHERPAAVGYDGSTVHSHGIDDVVSVAGVDLSAGHAASGGGGLGADECPTCSEHDMALGSCLLTLTLLVLSWLLLPPRLRQLPPFLRLRLPPALVRPRYARRIPSLSLTELSQRRT